MGQKTGDVLEQYIDTNNYNALKGNYRKALPYLAITEEVVMEENQEAIEKLESENQALKEQMRIERESNELKIATLTAKLESGLEQMNEKVNDLGWMQKITSDGLKPVSEEEMKKSLEFQRRYEELHKGDK